MPEFSFQFSRSIPLEPGDSAGMAELKAKVPRSALRRMSLLGLAVHAVLEAQPLGDCETLFYLSEFGESRMLERYLASFPEPSPLAFQASIHPSAVEQSLILRRQPLPRFFPIAAPGGLFSALRSLPPEDLPAILVGGDERGEWSAEDGLSSDRGFAWALTLRAAKEGGEGLLGWTAEERGSAAGEPFDVALRLRREWRDTVPGRGTLYLRWR